MGGEAKVEAPAFQPVALAGINLFRRAYTHNEPVHGLLARYGPGWVRAPRPADEYGVPLEAGNNFVVGSIHPRTFALRERSAASGWGTIHCRLTRPARPVGL